MRDISQKPRRVRSAFELSLKIRREFLSGKVVPGEYVPTQQALAELYGVAPLTARRALKLIESQGLIRAEPRRGFRALARINDPTNGHPLAFVLSEQKASAGWSGLHGLMLESFRKAAAERGWSLLAVGAESMQAAEVIEQCRAARAWGAILDTSDPQVVKAAAKAGLSVVLVDDWQADMLVDTVLQDDFRGGFLAARHLLAKGHRNFCWFGSNPGLIHHMFRLSGARAALRLAGVEPAADWATIAPEPDAVTAVRERFSHRARPTAVLALWASWTHATGTVARELGLEPGRDLEVVGWCTEQQYDQDYTAGFDGAQIPATVVWNPDEMADTAIARLAARREQPDMPPTLIQVNVRLLEARQSFEAQIDDFAAVGASHL